MNKQDFEQLILSLKDGNYKKSVEEAQKLIEKNYTKEDVVIHGIHPAMEMLDSKCTSEQFNLLELMLAGRAVSSVINLLFADMQVSVTTKPTVVLATLEGDIHDLGKNIVKIILIGKGYKVVDCGKDVSVEKIVTSLKESKAKSLCISGLITSIIPEVKNVKKMLIKNDLSEVVVLAGGAALKQSNKKELNVDYIGQTAFDAAHFLDSIFGSENE